MGNGCCKDVMDGKTSNESFFTTCLDVKATQEWLCKGDNWLDIMPHNEDWLLAGQDFSSMIPLRLTTVITIKNETPEGFEIHFTGDPYPMIIVSDRKL